MKTKYIPVTPGGTLCTWIAQETEQDAIDALMAEAAHMPYRTWEGFKARGYEIMKYEEDE